MDKRFATVFLLILLAVFQTLHAGTFVEKFGETAIPNTPWTIEISPDKNAVFSRAIPIGGGSVSPKWIPTKGWFVFAQNDKLLWAFDDADQLLLLRITPKSNIVYSIEHLPFPPPKEVLERLPTKVRARLPSKK